VKPIRAALANRMIFLSGWAWQGRAGHRDSSGCGLFKPGLRLNTEPQRKVKLGAEEQIASSSAVVSGETIGRIGFASKRMRLSDVGQCQL
jgi:hypothetical protein